MIGKTYKCPECHEIACVIKPIRLSGYDTRLRLVVCSKCGYKFYRNVKPKVDISKEQMILIPDT